MAQHKSERMILADDFWVSEPRKSPPGRCSLERMAEARLSRRTSLKMMAVAATSAFVGCQENKIEAADNDSRTSARGFQEVMHGYTANLHVPEGYKAQVLLRWGDKAATDAPAFDINQQTAAAQSKQFGYNNDFVAFLPLPLGSSSSNHGLLCVNHEYTEGRLMNARCLHRLRTTDDPTGHRVIGTLNNCAGGTTPWGTVLSGEENFQGYFGGDPQKYPPEARNHQRYSVGSGPGYAWHLHHQRFNLDEEPNEPNRFGWIVEIDPYEPDSTPIKRTALGRFRHEGGTTALAADGRVVVYMGDDDKGEYLYKFVTRGKYDPDDREANRHLLDEGILYVARFEPDGVMNWLPLEFGQGPLTPKNDFRSQADVLIETRRAADLLAATPMDRPEDVETNPVTGRVYVMLTNNGNREPDEVNAANPRAWNKHGHIVELIMPSAAGRVDHGAHKCFWDVFLMAGNPGEKTDNAQYHPEVSTHGWLSCPDNCAFDLEGRIWIATDGMPGINVADGVYVADTVGPRRALTRCFFQAPRGAEVCGPAFTPDGSTLFVAIQHPGDEQGSTFATPTTRWPDFDPKLPPRPSVVAITKVDGGVVGS